VTQPNLWDAPVSPAPSRGRTDRSREASRSGARAQVRCWSEKSSALLQVLANGGPMTRNELAAVLAWPISSVCSMLDRHLQAGRVVSAGDFETVRWDNGTETKRERFTVTR